MAQVLLTDKSILEALIAMHTKENTFPGEISHTFLNIDFTKTTSNTIKSLIEYRAQHIRSLNTGVWNKHNPEGQESYYLITDNNITSYDHTKATDTKTMIEFLCKQLNESALSLIYPVDVIKETQLMIDINSVDFEPYHIELKFGEEKIPLGGILSQ